MITISNCHYKLSICFFSCLLPLKHIVINVKSQHQGILGKLIDVPSSSATVAGWKCPLLVNALGISRTWDPQQLRPSAPICCHLSSIAFSNSVKVLPSIQQLGSSAAIYCHLPVPSIYCSLSQLPPCPPIYCPLSQLPTLFTHL